MNVSQLREKLFEEGELNSKGIRAAESVLKAYADSHEDLDTERNLNYFCPIELDSKQAVMIADRCIKEYNLFNKECMEAVVNFFGDDAKYFLAREGSVCIFIETNKNIRTSKIPRETRIDEISYDSRSKMYRLWWD